jgi:hypothetical protein
MPRIRKHGKDPESRLRALEAEVERLAKLVGAPRHIGAVVPAGGRSGATIVGNGKLWANDAGVWKSTAIA